MLVPPEPTSYPFHFAVLEQDQIASRGHDPETVDAAAAERYAALAERTVDAVFARGGKVDVIELLRDLAPNGQLPEDANGFRAYASIFGQPIGIQPSRMEQCLAIRTAMDDGMTGVPLSINPRNDNVSADDDYLFVVEDYLGECDELTATYKRALEALDPRASAPVTISFDEPIFTRETATFLLAEHLHLYAAQSKPFDEWLRELPRRRPGFVFLPFRVLGQYRACAVWMFQGKFDDDENKRLRDHVHAKATEANRWLPPTSSHAVLQVTSILFLKALTQFKDLVGTPLTVCHLAHQALASLWYTKVAAEPLQQLTAENNSVPVERSGLHQKIEIRIASHENAANLLGFERARYVCPYIPKKVKLDAELANAESVFRDVSEAAAAVRRQSEMRTREVMNKQAALTAHDYANGLQDLIAIMDTADCPSPVNTEARLKIATTMAEGLLGHAWVAREDARNLSGGLAEPRRTELQFRKTPPGEEDLSYWYHFLRRESILIASSAKVRAQRMADDFRGGFALRYRFDGETETGAWNENADWETIPIEANTADFSEGAPKRRRHFVPWPIRIEETTEPSAQAGHRAMMMWGAHELMRNACRSTVNHATDHSGEWIVSVAASIRQTPGAWLLSIEVTNPWTRRNDGPPLIHNISQWPDYIRLVLNNVAFKNGAGASDEVSYIYEFEVRK